jgi:sugar lactone lactonase YvrE
VSGSVELVWQAEAALGEGPLWLPGEQALWFVDIKRGKTRPVRRPKSTPS